MNKNKLFSIISSVFIFLTLIFIPVYIKAEEVTDETYGFSFDLPEEFFLDASTNDGLTHLFTSRKFPVNVILKIYPGKEDSKKCLEETLDKLSAEHDISSFTWNEKPSAFSIFKMTVPGETELSSGWALSSKIEKLNSVSVLLCYSKEKFISESQCFFYSILNSFKTDENDSITKGPLITFTFPDKEKLEVETEIEGIKVKSFINEADIEASKFAIDTEYNVLKYYAQSEKWKEAWIRYYKAIYRDTRGRIKTFTNDIYKVLYPISKQKNEKNMRYEINKMILNWVQSFSYGREKDANGSDFSPIPQILQGDVSDCDSRSILACAMLNQIGIESVLFISREYSHAIYGASVKNLSPAENARINIGEKSFLLCETTKKSLNPGLIAKDMSDESKWISVIFN